MRACLILLVDAERRQQCSVGCFLMHKSSVSISMRSAWMWPACSQLNFGGGGHFLCSPSATELPPDMGTFDAVVMSAVYEHLLPEERVALMPQLWSHLRPGGVLFLNQTPNRAFPIEVHTTKLPFINYLPDRMACWMARRFSRRVRAREKWPGLLRRGIRGGTLPEILELLSENHDQVNLSPSRLGILDPVELWFRSSGAMRARGVKRLMKVPFRIASWGFGEPMVPNLALAIRKVEARDVS